MSRPHALGPPRIVKRRDMPRETLERLILRERGSGRPLDDQEARIDAAQLAYTWWSGWCRLWRYIGQHEAARLG